MKRRKTSVAPPPPVPVGPQTNYLRTPYEPQETKCLSAGTSQRTPNVEEFELPPELYERLSQALHDLPENAAPVQRLLALCGSVCDAKLDILRKAGDKEDAFVLETVFKSFLESLNSAAESGSIQFAVPPSSTALELGDEDLRVDLEARKAGLRNRLALLKKEEQEWHDLLAKVEDLDIGEVSPEAEDEEIAAVGDKYAPEELAALRALNRDVHRKITMQVDGVCILVGNIEDLIDRANATAQEVHVQHHKKRFENFPHVDSPKFLLRKIMAPEGLS